MFDCQRCRRRNKTQTHLLTLQKIASHQPGTYHGIWVSNEISQRVQEALVLHHLGIDVMKFRHTHSCRLPHVRVLVLQALPQRLTQVLCDFVHPDAAHGADGQSSDERVGVLAVLENRESKAVLVLNWIDFTGENSYCEPKGKFHVMDTSKLHDNLNFLWPVGLTVMPATFENTPYLTHEKVEKYNFRFICLGGAVDTFRKAWQYYIQLINKFKSCLDLPWQSCWQPWWPCQVGSWHSSLSRGKPTSSAPGCQSACSSPHLETRNWKQKAKGLGKDLQFEVYACSYVYIKQCDKSVILFTVYVRSYISHCTWHPCQQSWLQWPSSRPLFSSPSSHCSALPSVQRSPLKKIR